MPSITLTVTIDTDDSLDWLSLHHLERRVCAAVCREGYDAVTVDAQVDGVETDGLCDSSDLSDDPDCA